MGNILFVVRVGVALCAMGVLVRAGDPADKAAKIVAAPYPGKNELGRCKTYADALFKALRAGHIPAWEICFLGGSGPSTYQHAMVVYKDAGAYWYADNIFPYPTKSWGKTAQEWVEDRCNAEAGTIGPVNIFSGPAPICAVLQVKSTVRGPYPGRLAGKTPVVRKNLASAQLPDPD